jgi:hypothetical protein
MALFVAKLLDSQKPKDTAPHDGDFSPYRRANQRRKEPFEQKLARVLRRGVRASWGLSPEKKEKLNETVSVALRTKRSSNPTSHWGQDRVDLFKSIQVPAGVESDPERFCDAAIEFLKNLIECETERQRKENIARELRDKELKGRLETVALVLPVVYNDFASLVDQLEKADAVLQSDFVSVRKLEFLENLIPCVEITNQLYAENNPFDEQYLERLALVTKLSESLIGRSKEIVQLRVNILTQRAISTLKEFIRAQDGKSELSEKVIAFSKLSKFEHPEPYRAISFFMSAKLEKFEFHFTRPSSALNVIDKPEWALRFLLDAALETAKMLPEEESQCIGRFLATRTREYYQKFRWELIQDPRNETESELFSLYLARYLHNVQQWAEAFGADVADEVMLQFADNHRMGPSGWFLLDEWIHHDWVHIKRVIEATKNPLQPSPYNSSVCALIQNLEDVLQASKERLQSVARHPRLIARFTESCHDSVIDDSIYAIRVSVSDGLPGDDTTLMKRSIEHLDHFLSQNELGSGGIRRQVSEYAKLI